MLLLIVDEVVVMESRKTGLKSFFIFFLMSVLVSACGSGAEFIGKSAKKSNTKPSQPSPTTTTDPVRQPTDKKIEFGVDKVFHIGDNNYPDSSCKEQIDTYSLSGNRYFFEFEVTEPQTQLGIVINKLCGVDYLLTNSSRLLRDGATLQVQPVLPPSNSIQYQGLTVGPGRYTLVVESNKNFNKVSTGDHDDFLVGNIVVTANKPIRNGVVRTE
jgi:hypothetical protein